MHILVSGGSANAQLHALAKEMKKNKLHELDPDVFHGVHSSEKVRDSVSGMDSCSTILRQWLFVVRVTYAYVGADHRGVLD